MVQISANQDMSYTKFDYQAAEGTAIVVTDTTDGDNVQNSVIVLVMVR